MSIYIYHVFIWGVLTSLVVSQGSGNGETNAGTSIYYDEDIASTTEPTQSPEDDEVTTEPILVPQSPFKPELRNNLKHTSETGNSCPKIGTVTNIPNSFIKCQCQGYEVLVDGNCTTYEGDVVVDAEEGFIYTRPRNVSTYTITIRDLICDTEMAEYKEFTKGMFRVRDRGDIILLKPAGDLDGLRIGNYCINHHLEDSGELTWTLKACIPVPYVPKCCPPGSAMKDGSCQSAETPAIFQPPVSAKPFANSIEWPNISHFVSNLTCSKYRHQTELLSYKQSHLVSLSNGVHMSWIPDENIGRRNYKRCPDYCVDGIDLHGSVDYYVSYCYTDPYDYHKEICGDGPCLRKCCKKGEVMDANRYACVKYENATFSPPTSRESSNYSIVEGWPLCTPPTKITGNFKIDIYGNFHNADITLDPMEYCVDMFISDHEMEQSGLACLATISVWQKVRSILFPICNVISLIFLAILLLCHLVSPSLLKNGGAHQLCHAVALSLAYGTTFSLSVFNYLFGDDGCIIIAIVMQFGFLATFFWLNVMCFETWRKIRLLKLFRSCKSYPSWVFILYAWGIPLLICVITVIMQYWAPENVFGLVKPNLGVSRCWFHDDLALFIYFYGPIAFLFICNSVLLVLTYMHYNSMLHSYKETHKCLKELGTGITSVSSSSKSSMPARQLTNHVNDYKQRLRLFVLMATCWVTEVLSWKIEPLELWSVTDTLNSLQGFFIFIIFLSNRNKRHILEKKFPSVFRIVRKIKLPTKLRQGLLGSLSSISPVNSIVSKVSKKLSNSTVITNITSSIESSSSAASFNVISDDEETTRSQSKSQSEVDIVALSYMPIKDPKCDQ